MTKVLTDEEFQQLKESLPIIFREQLKNEAAILSLAYPLLDKICKDRVLMETLRTGLHLAKPPSGQNSLNQLITKFQLLENQFNVEALFPYRLPIVLSEFPLHSRAINKAIKSFNEIIEDYHLGNKHALDDGRLAECYEALLKAIKAHGTFCDGESLWQLSGMMAGWSKMSLAELYHIDKLEAVIVEEMLPGAAPADHPVIIKDLKQPENSQLHNPFIPDYNYNYNAAGRLASESYFLLVNAFGMKIGGHLDGQEKIRPRFITLEQFHAMIHRQLSHRIEYQPTAAFQLWLETSLHQLGIEFIKKGAGDYSSNILVNPFIKEPISFLSPEKIYSILQQTLTDFVCEELNPGESDLEILSQYLFELLQGFQINPGQALGIGANWDGTINLTNEAGASAFKFTESHADWGKRFKQLSLHRQGPSEARMNAAVGIKFEVFSLLTDFDYMSQLQATEYPEVLYNALIDNLVSELFPDPPYFENANYQKYRKHHVVRRNEQGIIEIDSFYQANNQGTYFKDSKGIEKQTPMYRRAGTLDVQAFPRNSTCSEQSKVCYAGNPLGPLQLQYAQAMFRTARGHVVYDPLADDQFLQDDFYGQVIRGNKDDYLPFIGVVPKNFDKHFEQSKELCASFVIRMLQSSHIMEYCPTFKDTYEQIKTGFLPAKESQLPVLPKFCAEYLNEKLQHLQAALFAEVRDFSRCQKEFSSLFKNLIYSLYEMGKEDEQFRHTFLAFIHTRDYLYPISKAKCEKLIRDFTVNRPVNVSPDVLARYDETISFLQAMTKFFYPAPTDALAQIIARQAKHFVPLLLQSSNIQAYFASLTRNRQTNLSRKQSPGMLYAALKHNGPSKTVVQDYREMHDYNFPSFYRDSDGTPNGEPQTNDKVLDWGAKKLGAFLQLLHKYHLFAVIRKPLSQPYLRAKEQAALHQFDKFKPLWMIQGALKGFFWDGLILGLWETTKTPFFMLADFVELQYQRFNKKTDIKENNPLALPAAPANESCVKSLTAASTRDYLLQMLDTDENIEIKKLDVIANITQLLKKLYLYLTPDEFVILNQHLLETFPLVEESWDILFKRPFHFMEDQVVLGIFQKNASNINNSLIQSIFRCLTHPELALNSKMIIKQVQSFFSLNAKQKQVLVDVLKHYAQLPVDAKQQFINLFRFNGVIHAVLQKRDHHLQVIQGFILKVFDEEWVLERLFEKSIGQLSLVMSPQALEQIISRLPDSIKSPLAQLLKSNNPSVLEDYILSEAQLAFLLKVLDTYQHMPENEEKAVCLRHCHIDDKVDENVLSVKDKAHNKWAKFAERELKHQLLTLEEAEAVFAILSTKLSKLPYLLTQIERLKAAYQALDQVNEDSLTLLFEIVTDINNRLIQFPAKKNKSVKLIYTEAQILISNFINVTMNAIVNFRLDQVDIYSVNPVQNPLLPSKSIESWLSGLQQKNYNLRLLLEQQVQQAPSLDHSLWRCKCILQVLEQLKPDVKITKTGMKCLIRFWSQHKENVTMTGDRFINPATGEGNTSNQAVLFNDSVTMQHTLTKLKSSKSF